MGSLSFFLSVTLTNFKPPQTRKPHQTGLLQFSIPFSPKQTQKMPHQTCSSTSSASTTTHHPHSLKPFIRGRYGLTVPGEDQAIVVSTDSFFIKYPFFVTFVGVIWLVVIPLAQYHFSSYKYTSALYAFQKLRDDPNAALLDIRDDKSVAFLGTPDLTLFNKTALHVHFCKDDDDHKMFVNKVLGMFKDPTPANAVVCVIDNFDGSSLKVAKLLVKNGFKEAYAIKGGLRGKRGWEEIQEDVFPPSVHVYPKSKTKGSNKKERTEDLENVGNARLSQDNGSIKKPISSTSGPGKDL